MSLINLSLKHGRTLPEARASLEKAVKDVQDMFGAMIQRADWSSDRNRVRMERRVLRQAAVAVPGQRPVVPCQAAGVVELPPAAVLQLRIGVVMRLEPIGLRRPGCDQAERQAGGRDEARFAQQIHGLPPSANWTHHLIPLCRPVQGRHQCRGTLWDFP